ncbi:hypothetical protein H0H92_009608 [Tricholoma furcatifolium]|nr:hypothetical protein H0H92_009608 [Tricholoma furcatifolium]
MGFFGFPSQNLSVFTPSAVEHDLSFHLRTATRPASLNVRPKVSSLSSSVPLPLEIVLAIIEQAAYADGTPDYHLLRCCTLVCKSWTLPTQKLLFSSIILSSQTSCDAFLRSVSRQTTKGRILGGAVVRLRAVVDHNQPFGLSQRSLAEAITHCPRLFDVNLSLYGHASPAVYMVGYSDASRMSRSTPSFDEPTLALLRSGPSISSLQLNNWSDNAHCLTQLLDVWPKLTSLVIGGILPEAPSPSLTPFPGALSELRMNFQSSPSPEFVHWLLHNSVATLKVVEFERDPPSQLLQSIIDVHGSCLQSLTFPSARLSENVRAVQACPQLRELRIENASASVARELWRALPETIEHIALGMDVNTVLRPLVDVVRKAGFLKAITVHAVNGGERHPVLPVLKMVCAYRGVDLRMIQDIRTFRSQLRGDPVRVSTFPRSPSLNNIYIMRC